MLNKDCLFLLQRFSINQLLISKKRFDFANKQVNQAIDNLQTIVHACPPSYKFIDAYGYLLGISFPISFQIAMAMRDYFYLCSHEILSSLNLTESD